MRRHILLTSLVILAGLVLSACNGVLPAGAEIKIGPDGQSAEVEFTGTVETIAADQWQVSGQTLLVTPATVMDGTFAVGDPVKVLARVDTSGAITALKFDAFQATPNPTLPPIQTPQPDVVLEFIGVVESIGPEAWTISGRQFAITLQTEIKGVLEVGNMVKVHAVQGEGGGLVATEIELAERLRNGDDQGNGNLVRNRFEFELVGVVEAIGPTAWIVSGQTFQVTLQTEVHGTINVGDIVKVHAFFGTDGALTAREIERELANLAGFAEVEFVGTVASFANGTMVVNGFTVLITQSTEIKGIIAAGDIVKVEGFIGADGTFTAREVKKLDLTSLDDDDDRSGSNSGSNSGPGSGDDDDDHDDDDDDDHDDDDRDDDDDDDRNGSNRGSG